MVITVYGCIWMYMLLLGSGSGGFGRTDCRQRLHFPWADRDAEVLATPYRESSFDHEKARSLSKKGWQFPACSPVYHMQLDEEFGIMLPCCVLNNLQPFQPQCLQSSSVTKPSCQQSSSVALFWKKNSFPSPLPQQNPNDNFILWKPSFRTTQQEHAAAQISMAVKMGDAFWYATWYTDWENQRTSDPKLNVDPNVQGIMILLDILCMRKFKVMDMKNTCHCLLGYSFNIWQFPSSSCKPRLKYFAANGRLGNRKLLVRFPTFVASSSCKHETSRPWLCFISPFQFLNLNIPLSTLVARDNHEQETMMSMYITAFGRRWILKSSGSHSVPRSEPGHFVEQKTTWMCSAFRCWQPKHWGIWNLWNWRISSK